MGIESNYEIRTDNDEVLSVDIYVVNTVGSSSTIHRFYNINKKTGEVITLSSRFENDNDYIKTIATKIMDEIDKRNETENPLYWTTYEEVYNILSRKEQFYINESGNVVIVFDKYEIGAGALGCPEFEIKR